MPLHGLEERGRYQNQLRFASSTTCDFHQVLSTPSEISILQTSVVNTVGTSPLPRQFILPHLIRSLFIEHILSSSTPRAFTLNALTSWFF